LLLLTATAQAQQPVPRTVFVHLFEWTWNDIARECEDFLGPKGYAAVQISPPNEHRLLLGRPWYERYQPVSYRLTSRSGTREEFTQMIRRCHEAGVKIYADAIINHMASCRPNCDQGQPQYGDRGVAGSTYPVGAYRFEPLFDEEDRQRIPGALNAYHPEHFHQGCQQVNDWNDPWQVQNCELERLADLATGREDVRNTLANYLATLFVLGVDGLRIDAAKHLSAADLRAILTQAAQAADVRIEGTDIHPGGARSVLVYQEIIGDPPDPAAAYANGKVTEFEYGRKLGEKFLDGPLHPLNGQVPFGEGWGLQSSLVSIAFIDNHDNQRGHGGGGAVIKAMRNRLGAYALANVFMLAWPYGYPQVMSSYRFGNGEIWRFDQNPAQDITSVVDMPVRDDFLGPPHDGVHRSVLQAGDYAAAGAWTTRRVWVEEGGRSRNTCFDADSKWMCEHRWRPIANMVAFRNHTLAAWRVDHWWDNGHNQIAFGRGSLGFVVINNEDSTLDRTLQTGLRAGRYCNAWDGERVAQGCTGSVITVNADGMARFQVAPRTAAAIHVGATIPEEDGQWRRTVVLIQAETVPGQDLFVRGGIDHDHANRQLNRNCTTANYQCAIPIQHLNLRNPTTQSWKQGDDYLDWYGRERNQQGSSHGLLAEGTPLDWTTQRWPEAWGPKRTVAVEGFGEEPLNQYGPHYWMLDVRMDCSRTADGWFEFKSYISNGPGWEGNLQQLGTPYASGNHFGRCGYVNVYQRGKSEATMIPLAP
jgi:alpha-amylase